jgi:glycine reductase
MTPIRIVHYINQYFAGVGGEEHADARPELREEAVGPGIGLQAALGEEGIVVATVFCGDEYAATGGDEAAAEIVELVRPLQPDVFVAGPSFGSGRYGLACGAMCVAVQEQLGVPAVAGMHEESPGAEQFRRQVAIVPTRETAAGMRPALPELARLALKLGRGEALGSPEEDGYLQRGLRRNEFRSERAAKRAVEMLLAKLHGEPHTTEWPLPRYDRVDAPAAVGAGTMRIALVSEGGVVPTGNPDRIPSGWATTWAKYDVGDVDDLDPARFESIHGGFDTAAANADPDRLIPLDALREVEREGRVEIHPYLYSTVGNMGSLKDMRRVGAEMGEQLRKEGIQAVLVGAT